MADSTLTKKDVLNFLNLGRKIVFSGASTALGVAKSKIVDLIDSDEALQKRVEAQVQALIRAGFTEAEAVKAITDKMKSRFDRAVEKITNPDSNSVGK
ncbi:MAG: hypothetical protein A3C61_00980 [Candidatus Yanofskybacteria bacterium RIFCSPHIGHO2_02_FULL_39_10]|uniref:Uncharacterized protein n=1 Tax=Candidatus Yanofskybacteria bacterium RIFCSPHIGHO2_02_FULL_39_10 TaxID=1802674 RepID=A0A1F8F7M6_9BACT|nr:MAG: hypothetical protein A3C61_00980 [Candidatus Yanofskybacteria bacterium RIFCSPHIGHO2_02_FULL_39_10]